MLSRKINRNILDLVAREEYGNLSSKWKDLDLLSRGIEILSAYVKNNPWKYKSHYAVLGTTGWVYERASAKGNRRSPPQKKTYDEIKEHNFKVYQDWQPKGEKHDT